MSPRHPSSSPVASTAQRSTSAPYPRRPSGQPKSTRQQFSACGACRMRRVRCDLKDLPIASAGPHPSCSNCRERGLKCVDEFADVKAVKLLRRGRRLQQVEAIYGKASDPDGNSPMGLSSSARLPSIIPNLEPEFFSSQFWAWFSLHRPILDPTDFPARFYAHVKGTGSLGHEGGLIAMLLVIWAASFGIDERGMVLEDGGSSFASDTRRRNSLPGNENAEDGGRTSRRDRTSAMLREALELVDFHGVLRRPTWDGVRVLFLILPLLEDASSIDRLSITETALSQANLLCTLLQTPAHPGSGLYSPEESVLRSRIYWYAYMQEGITSGIRGGRLVLTEDDWDVFQSTLSTFGFGSSHSTSSSGSFPQMFNGSPGLIPDHTAGGGSHGSHPYLHMNHLFSIPLQLGKICRKAHQVLLGAKAAKRIESSSGRDIDAMGMREMWDGLERCWDELEGVRRGGLASGDVDPMVDRFVSGWQIFIFECHNIIREALKQLASTSVPGSPQSAYPRSNSNSPASASLPAAQLLSVSQRHCLRLLPAVLQLIKHQVYLTVPAEVPDVAGLFKWDTGLVRDGVFFAGFLAASITNEMLQQEASRRSPISAGLPGPTPFLKQETQPDFERVLQPQGGLYDVEEGVSVCLAAISEMRWAFSKADEREENIKLVWHETQMRNHNSAPGVPSGLMQSSSMTSGNTGPFRGPPPSPIGVEFPHAAEYAHGGGSHYNVQETHGMHPPPLSLVTSTHVDSAPSTACSVSSSGSGWPTYTPPGTAHSGTSSMSGGGSPVFGALVSGQAGSCQDFKGMPAAPTTDMDTDAFYQHVTNDLEQFGFNVPSSGGGGSSAASGMPVYSQRSPISTSAHGSTPGGYLDFGGSADVHFGEEVGAFYPH